MKKYNTITMVLVGLFAAILSIFAPIAITLPFTAVPISLATFAVYLCGAVLGPTLGTTSVAIYLLLGLVGVPVFSGYTAGVQKLAGPTGGYIIGYLFMAFFTGLAIRKYPKKYIGYPLGMLVGTIACYAVGTAWFMVQSGTKLSAAMTMCVYPFIPGDILKIIAAIALAFPLNHALRGQLLRRMEQ